MSQEKLPPIYLDNNSTTAVHPKVTSYITHILSECFGNPSSQHIFGWQAKEVIEIAREEIATLLGTSSSCIVFTSGATEANNILLQGFADKSLSIDSENVPHFIATQIEHSSVLQPIFNLERKKKCTYTLLPNNEEGLIDLSKTRSILDAITQKPLLFSIQHGNNEIGSLQPLHDLLPLATEKGAFFHSDITQIIGKIPFSFKETPIDAVSLSGHKFHGPKGIGVLAFRNDESIKKIAPLYSGGAQESGLRPGTISTHLIGGIGEASKMSREQFDHNKALIEDLTISLYTSLKALIPTIRLLGPSFESGWRLPGNINILIPEISGAKLCSELSTTIAMSTSSACLTQAGKFSHVLTAIGLSEQDALSVVRMGISHMNSLKEIEFAASKIVEKIIKIRGT
jgi:cysteine desulfurase